MSDFLLQFGQPDLSRMASYLRDRPGMADANLHSHSFPWGSVVVQEPRGRGYVPCSGRRTLHACVGRPRFMGVTHENGGDTGFNERLANCWAGEAVGSFYGGLTGMYALLRCHAQGVDLITDQMGFQAVYGAAGSIDGAAVLGTHPDAVARLAGRGADFDLVSLGELLVFGNITFPHTTRLGMREFRPACHYTFDMRGVLMKDHVLWAPQEGDSYSSGEEAEEAVVSSLRQATEDVTRGCPEVAVTLSGGMDSRTVLAAVPSPQRAAALTYVGRRNREVDTAARIARVIGVPHVLATRDDEYYSDLLLSRGPALLGSERRAVAHGLCVVDNDLQARYDLILGGQLSDTHLKGHYMPMAMKERLRPRLWPESVRDGLAALFGKKDVSVRVSPLSPVGRHLLLPFLTADVSRAVRERRAGRTSEVGEVRPVTGEEWSRFWPGSRNDDLADISASMRLFAFDSPFMHREVVEVARRLTPEQKYGGWVANAAFLRLMGPEVAGILNANTGVPAVTTRAELARSQRRLRRERRAKEPSVEEPARTTVAPWTHVSGSWVNFRLLQLHSPVWAAHRRQLADSSALSELATVISGPRGRGIRAYAEDLPPGMNAMAMQLARMLDLELRAPAGGRSTEPARDA